MKKIIVAIALVLPWSILPNPFSSAAHQIEHTVSSNPITSNHGGKTEYWCCKNGVEMKRVPVTKRVPDLTKPIYEDTPAYATCKANAKKLSAKHISEESVNTVSTAVTKIEQTPHTPQQVESAVSTQAQASYQKAENLKNLPQTVQTQTQAIINALPKNKAQLYADIQKIVNDVFNHAETAISDLKKFTESDTNCTFLMWPIDPKTRKRSFMSMKGGLVDKTHSPVKPQPGQKLDLSAYCKKHIPSGYSKLDTLSVPLTQEQLIHSLSGSILKAVNSGLSTISTNLHTVVSDRTTTNKAQTTLNNSVTAFNKQVNTIDTDLKTVKNTKVKLAHTLAGASVQNVLTILKELAPSQATIISQLGTTVLTAEQIKTLQTDVTPVLELLVGMKRITAAQQAQIISSITSINNIAVAEAKLKTAYDKLTDRTLHTKLVNAHTTIQNAQQKITTAQTALNTALLQLQQAYTQMNAIIAHAKVVLGATIKPTVTLQPLKLETAVLPTSLVAVVENKTT